MDSKFTIWYKQEIGKIILTNSFLFLLNRSHDSMLQLHLKLKLQLLSAKRYSFKLNENRADLRGMPL